MIELTREELLRARHAGSDALLPVPAMADHLGVSVRTVHSWVLAGKLPVVRVAGRWHALLSHASKLEQETHARLGGRPPS